MRQLIFACQWEKDRRNSWSGTNLSLYQSLGHYFNLCDYPLEKANILKRALVKFDIIKDDFGISNMKKQSKNFKGDKNCPVFQFGEVPYKFNNKQFVYQDLSVDYIKFMCDNQIDDFEVSSYQRIPYKAIVKRTEYQNNFYFSENCAGVFTMGEWLAKFLVEKTCIPSNKVFHVGGE